MQSIVSTTSVILAVLVIQFCQIENLQAQKQMTVESDPKFDIYRYDRSSKFNRTFTDVVGLSVHSEPTSGRGLGRNFYRGLVGHKALSQGTGLLGEGSSAYGVRGISNGTGFGAYFRGNGGKDIVLGGSSFSNGQGNDDGVISTEPMKSGSDLWLVSNDEVIIQLDENEDEAGNLIVINGEHSNILNLDETGKLEIAERLVLGGFKYGNGSAMDEGVISTDPSLPISDLWLVSDDALVLQLDQDNDENGDLQIKNGAAENVLTVSESGETKIKGELQGTATGSANMKPLCYGSISAGGGVNSGSGKFDLFLNGPGLYRIDIDGEPSLSLGDLDNDTVIVTPRNEVLDRVSYGSTDGAPLIQLWSDSDVRINANFSFMIFKP